MAVRDHGPSRFVTSPFHRQLMFFGKKPMQKAKFKRMVHAVGRSGEFDWSYIEKREKFPRKMEEKFEFGTGCGFSVKVIPFNCIAHPFCTSFLRD